MSINNLRIHLMRMLEFSSKFQLQYPCWQETELKFLNFLVVNDYISIKELN